MRLEYVVVGIILTLVVFVVVIAMLSGVIPNLDSVLGLFK
jgi:hypothetical protein